MPTEKDKVTSLRPGMDSHGDLDSRLKKIETHLYDPHQGVFILLTRIEGDMKSTLADFRQAANQTIQELKGALPGLVKSQESQGGKIEALERDYSNLKNEVNALQEWKALVGKIVWAVSGALGAGVLGVAGKVLADRLAR